MAEPTRDDAWELFCGWTESDSLRKHALGVEAAYSIVDLVGEERAFGDPAGALADLAERVARTWAREPETPR